MELKTAYQKMITSMQGGWGAMAGALGLTVAALENHVYEKKGQEMSVRMARQLQDLSDTDHFVEALAKDRGGVFVKLPTVGDVENEDLLLKFNELHAELGNLSREFAADTKDGEIDAKEAARLEAIAQRIHQIMEELLALTMKIYRKQP